MAKLAREDDRGWQAVCLVEIVDKLKSSVLASDLFVELLNQFQTVTKPDLDSMPALEEDDAAVDKYKYLLLRSVHHPVID